jgi:hypothetical protein
MDKDKEKPELKFSTLAVSKLHKKKLLRYAKQQGKDQKSVIEYLIAHAIYHDLNVHLPIPKSKKADPVTQEDFSDFKSHIENVVIRASRANPMSGANDSYYEETIKKLKERIADITKRKDEDYKSAVRQWNEALMQVKDLQMEVKDLKKKLEEKNQGK